MIGPFEEMLTGGHPNSLGRTEEVVVKILKDKNLMQDLYDCYRSVDEVVRLRVSSAFKRITETQPEWMVTYIDRFIDEVSHIDQPSAQWSFAQIMLWLDGTLSPDQKKRARDALKRILETSQDWIVLNMSMETLTCYAKSDAPLRRWLVQRLKVHTKDTRKSVSKRANKFLEVLNA